MNFESARINMINQQLRPNGVLNEEVLKLINEVPREDFVPQEFKEFALSDMRIALNHGQSMMTPTEETLILQAMMPLSNKVVLEVGTGSGYLTALLAKLAKHVYSIEYYADFTADATKKLANQGINNVTLITGDGLRGYLDYAPYDAIVFGGAIARLQKSYRPQLMKEGKLFAVLGEEPIMGACLLTLDHEDKWQSRLLFETKTQALINRMAKPTFVF